MESRPTGASVSLTAPAHGVFFAAVHQKEYLQPDTFQMRRRLHDAVNEKDKVLANELMLPLTAVEQSSSRIRILIMRPTQQVMSRQLTYVSRGGGAIKQKVVESMAEA